jgi:hypothetical protein
LLPLPDDVASARFWAAGECGVRLRAVNELTMAAEDLVAALYEYADCPPDGGLTVVSAGELAAVELAIGGLSGLQRRAAMIAVAERGGTLAAPGWLAECRQFVAGMLAASPAAR